jgi:hypothetical protein
MIGFIVGLFALIVLVAVVLAALIFVLKLIAWVFDNIASIIGFFLLVGVVGAVAYVAANYQAEAAKYQRAYNR